MARIQRYPSQISALIPEDHYERMKVIELAHPVSLADVIREAIEAGLPSVEARYAQIHAAEPSGQ
jgi:predicted DNA-binding protein